MSKKSEAAAALVRERESEAETRRMLFDYDARMDRQAELDRQHRQQIVDEARSQLAQDRLEAEAAELDVYRATAIAAALSNKSLAPQVAAMIPVGLTSRQDVDDFVQLGIDKTAEIVAEVSGQRGEPIPQGQPDQQQPIGDRIVIDKSLSMRDYIERVRPSLNINERDRGIFS